MELNINIDEEKSNIFLELLSVLKKDNMINDFRVINHIKLNTYEKELLEDLNNISEAIDDANNSRGVNTNRKIDIDI